MALSEEEIEKYVKAGKIASDAIKFGISILKEGELAEKVADDVENFIIKRGAGLAFPVNLSINDEAAHYTPDRNDKRIFNRNDIIKLDLGAHVDGYIADTAVTVEIGKESNSSLSRASETALKNVMISLRPGIRIGEIGKIIENSINFFGFKPIYNLTGHQLKKYILHAGLSIPNYDDGTSSTIEVGMAFAIEPFATNGEGFVRESRFGNIMQIMNEDDDTRNVYEKFKTLPFCTRWIYNDFPMPERVIDRLLKSKNVYKFPILKEKKKGMVSQFEHTFVVTGDRIYVTTL